MGGTRYASNTPRGIRKRRVRDYENRSDQKIPRRSEKATTEPGTNCQVQAGHLLVRQPNLSFVM
jgi:hypothetical protein